MGPFERQRANRVEVRAEVKAVGETHRFVRDRLVDQEDILQPIDPPEAKGLPPAMQKTAWATDKAYSLRMTDDNLA